jgi:hypothetical protein
MVSCIFGSGLVVAWVPYLSATMSSLLPFASSDHRLTLRIGALPQITFLLKWGNFWRNELHIDQWPTLRQQLL